MQNTEAKYCLCLLRSQFITQYLVKLADLDAALNALKQKLRDLFGMFAAFAQSRYNETNEISIYNYLLGFEEGRLADALHRVQVELILKVNTMCIPDIEEGDSF